MKSTTVFLTLLFFVSCICISPEQNPALVQLTKDPRAEGIFSMIAVQMKSGKGGFNQILSLLTELVDDARSQLHENRLAWRGNKSFCRVQLYSLNEKQDFFDNQTGVMKQTGIDANSQLKGAESLRNVRLEVAKVYRAVLKDEIASHKFSAAQASASIKSISHGIKAATNCIAEVSLWTAGGKGGNKGPKFVQEQIKIISSSYFNAKKFKVDVPTEFVEMAGVHTKVKKRLLEWLADVKVELVNCRTELTEGNKDYSTQGAVIEKELKSLADDCDSDAKSLLSVIADCKNVVKACKKYISEFSKLSSKNKGAVKTTQKWCKVETSNALKVLKINNSQVKLFKKVRRYFINNYAKINKFIKSRYH